MVKFPKLVNALFATNVRYFNGVTPEYSKEKKAEQETQEMAIKDARTEADKIAHFTGMKVDSVWAVSETPFTMIQSQILGQFPVALGSEDAGSDNKAVAAPEYRIAPIKITRSVQIIYLISPAK